MKDKKIQKIAQRIIELVKTDNQKADAPRSLPYFAGKRSYSDNHIEYCELEEKTQKKFIKFVKNLLKIKSKIQMEISENSILISGDLQKSKSARASHDDFEIKIDSNGFRFRRNANTFYNFRDTTILEELKPLLIEKNR